MAMDRVLICRVCLSQKHDLKSINQINDPIANFSQFFTLLTSVLIDEQNDQYNLICERCTNQVVDAYQLRVLALSSDSYLRLNRLESKQPKPVVFDNKEDTNNNDVVKEKCGTKKKYVCPVCFKEFGYQSEMLRHKSTHTPAYKCSTCNKTFGFKSSLLRHEKVHLQSESAICEICSSQFRSQDLLLRHKRYAHSVRDLKCSKCDARFETENALRSHTHTHTHTELPCRHRHCDKSFSLPHQRTRHEATHSGSKNFFCDECGKGFIQSHHLASHLTLHRPGARLVCTVSDCGKTFPNKYSLERHLKLHGKESVKCPKCTKRFSSSIKLRRHQRNCNKLVKQRPVPEEKVSCSFCQKTFTSKYIKKHLSRCISALNYSNSAISFISNIDNLNITINEMEHVNSVDTTKESSERIVEDVADMMEDQLTAKASSYTATAPSIEDVGSLCGSCACVEEPCSTAEKPIDVDNSDCKALLGKCIVSSEDCICARVSRKEDPLPEYLTTPLLAALQQQGYDPM